jgi:CRP-like cAMP-binding protein
VSAIRFQDNAGIAIQASVGDTCQTAGETQWVQHMIDIDESLRGFPVISLAAGENLLEEGQQTDCIYFLDQGSVTVIQNGCEVGTRRERGAVFGEMSVLLKGVHSATVQCLEPSTFYRIEDPQAFLLDHPHLIWHVAEILALRLFNLTQYLVDVKRQYAGHDHLEMVDDVLNTLLNQQKTSVLRRGESSRETPDY